jgi:hypothetical protein
VYGLAHYSELRSIRQKLYTDRLPLFTPKLKRRYGQPFLNFLLAFFWYLNDYDDSVVLSSL